MSIWELLTSPKGRVGRITFFLCQLAIALPLILLGVYEVNLENFIRFPWIIYVVLAYPTIITQIKRWHDRGESGWWCLLTIVPFGEIWVFIECTFLAGDEGENRYGEAPLNKKMHGEKRVI